MKRQACSTLSSIHLLALAICTYIAAIEIESILVTDTTPLEGKLARCEKLIPLTVAPILGEAIRRIHENSSVSSLFV